VNLDEYKDPADPYAPRPKASQAVAAQKRQRPTHDTEPITPLAAPTRQYVPVGVGALLITLLMIGAGAYQLSRNPALPLSITPVPTEAAASLPSGLLEASTAVPTPVKYT
jgi:hypothetical protein